MEISFRAARNLSISVMMLFIIVLGCGSVFTFHFVGQRHAHISEKIVRIENLLQIDQCTQKAINRFEALLESRSSDTEPVLAQVDHCIRVSEQFRQAVSYPLELNALDKYHAQVNLFRAALISFSSELRYDSVGSGAKELEKIASTLKQETNRTLSDIMTVIRDDIQSARSQIDGMLALSQQASLIIVAAGVGIGLCIAFFLTKVLGRPIRRLEDGTRKVIEGDLTHRVRIDSEDEIGRLADAFNLMTESLEKAQGQLVMSEKMAAIGQLAAGVAHEINNPISFVMSNFNALQEYFDDLIAFISEFEKKLTSDPGAAAMFKQMAEKYELDYLTKDTPLVIKESLEGTHRVKDIVSALKDYAHPGDSDGQFAETDINENIEKALSLVHNQIKYHCRLIKDFGKLPAVRAHPRQLQQVFVNLLVNAAQSIEQQGVITVKTYAKNGCVVLEFSDTGKGIPEAQIRRIFDPFFTTKQVGEGTGLGLSISYRIIEEHYGRIHVESRTGQGTTFFIELPCSE